MRPTDDNRVLTALEAHSAGRRALFISLAGLGLTAVIQAVVVVISGSVALLGDTMHNVADALTAVPLLVAFTLARRPATKRYTWKAADPVIGLLITVAILGVLRSAVRQVGAGLVDAVDPGLVNEATAAVLSVDGVHDVREL